MWTHWRGPLLSILIVRSLITHHKNHGIHQVRKWFIILSEFYFLLQLFPFWSKSSKQFILCNAFKKSLDPRKCENNFKDDSKLLVSQKTLAKKLHLFYLSKQNHSFTKIIIQNNAKIFKFDIKSKRKCNCKSTIHLSRSMGTEHIVLRDVSSQRGH